MSLKQSKQPFLECGRAVSTHGVRGTLRVECWCDSPSVLAALKTVYRRKNGEFFPYKVEKASVQKQMVLLTLEGVDTLEQAIALKGAVFFAAREELSELTDGVFIADLIGLPVIDADSGFVYGTLADVTSIGIHDVYTVRRPDEFREIQPEALLPAVAEYIKKVDTESGIYIRPIEGFFEPPAAGDGGGHEI